MFIHNVEFSNFYSFYESSTLDFTTTKNKSSHSADLHAGRYVNKINGFFGANGSGKTTALKAIAFIDFFAYSSFPGTEKDENILIETHALHVGEPSEFKIEYSHLDDLFRYEFSILNGKVTRETLKFLNTETKKFNSIFKRELKETGYKNSSFHHANINKYLEMFGRENCSFASYVYYSEPSENLKKKTPLFYKAVSAFEHLRTNVVASGKNDDVPNALFELSESLVGNEKVILRFIEEVVKNIDLGIESLEIKKIQVLDNKKMLEKDLIFANHVDEAGEKYSISVFNESTGTQKILCALWRILPIMWSGGTAVYDELDSDLHPYMMPFVIDLFMNPEINLQKGQLIFSGHTLEAIKDLERSQIFFAEKNNLRSEIYRCDDLLGLRSDENIYKKYVQGALGGVPNLDATNISLTEIIEEVISSKEDENASKK
ncbi:AAA family ATPase [Vreelandella alkaliphila]|uniref:AAA family ATPase n=1 Tax=Vreelandella alkaliphila TaxID=272774 RepID=UPI00232F00C9|nr:ATP-binding protein [Halomonas alkaliphila]